MNKVKTLEIIRNAGFRATQPRNRILQALQKAKRPLSAKRIEGLVKTYGIDPATVYRTLNTLVDANIVKQIDLKHGHAHYELTDQNDHHHLVCISCEKIEDFTGCDFSAITKTALKQSKVFKEVTQHSLELFGLCTSCAKRK